MSETITIRPESLAPGREVFNFVTTSFIAWLVRGLIVWGFLAIFFPALGATYVFVLAGLWVLRHVMPPSMQERVHAVKAMLRKG